MTSRLRCSSIHTPTQIPRRGSPSDRSQRRIPRTTDLASSHGRRQHPRSRLSELVVDKVQSDVQDRGGVGQPTDAEEVDTRLGIRPRDLQGQPTGGLDLNALAGSPHCLDRLTQQIDGHVVAEQEPRPGGHGFEGLSGGRDLDLYVHGRVGQMNGREGSGDRTSRQLVVVLNHGHIVQAHSFVGAASAAHGVLLQGPQSWRCLAGVQNHGTGAFKNIGPGPGVGRNSREPADQVQHRALPHEGGPGRTSQYRYDVALMDRVTILTEQLHVHLAGSDALGHRPKDQRDQWHPGQNTIGSGHDVRRAALGHRDGGEAGDVEPGEDSEVLVEGAVDHSLSASLGELVHDRSWGAIGWNEVVIDPSAARTAYVCPSQWASSRSVKSERTWPPRVSSRSAATAVRSCPTCNRFEVSQESGSAVEPDDESAMTWRSLAAWANESAHRTAPVPSVMARWIAVRSLPATSVVSWRRTRGWADFRSPADRREVMWSAMR